MLNIDTKHSQKRQKDGECCTFIINIKYLADVVENFVTMKEAYPFTKLKQT